jgi:hypothetical protein
MLSGRLLQLRLQGTYLFYTDLICLHSGMVPPSFCACKVYICIPFILISFVFRDGLHTASITVGGILGPHISRCRPSRSWPAHHCVGWSATSCCQGGFSFFTWG